MFERFTERARQVVVLAQEEARNYGHSYIGMEHLFLGIVREEEGIGARALAVLGIHVDTVRQYIEEDNENRSGQLPFTDRAKKSLELALREAIGIGHNYIGTEHLLLGWIRDPGDWGNAFLEGLGVTPSDIRAEVMRQLTPKVKPSPKPVAEPPQPTWEVVLQPGGISEQIIQFGTTKPRYGVGVDPAGLAAASILIVSADHDDPVVVVPLADRSRIIIRLKDES